MSRLICVVHATVIAAVALMPLGQARLAAPLDDAFQEGEYLGGPSAGFAWGSTPAPTGRSVLIHGAMDLLPRAAAAALCNPDAQIVCTRAVNFTLQGLTAALLLGIAAFLGGFGTVVGLMATVPAALMLLGNRVASPLAVQQSSPGLRDLLVIAAIVPILVLARATRRPTVRPGLSAPDLAALTLGALAVTGPLWSYNRGLVLGVAVAGITGLVCYATRALRPAWLAAAGAMIALVVLVAAGAGPRLAATATDIAYWTTNRDLWRITASRPMQIGFATLHVTAALLAAAALWPDGRTASGSDRRDGLRLVAPVLVAIGLLYFMQTLDRSDLSHLRWTLWPTTLLVALALPRLPRPALASPLAKSPAFAGPHAKSPAFAGPLAKSTAFAGPLAAVLMAIGMVLAAEDRPRAALSVLSANLILPWSALPSDRALAPPALVDAADRVRAAGRCTFAANNALIVHALSGQPPCSRFAAGAYIALDRQDEVIAALEATRPALILWDAPSWWAAIDSKPFPVRAPRLAAWIVAHYPTTTVRDGFVLRSAGPQSVSWSGPLSTVR